MIEVKIQTGLSKTKSQPSVLTSILATSGLILVAICTPVSAKTFGVKIVDESGQSMSNVSVCVGLPGNPTKYGSLLSDESGLALLDVPKLPFVLTVSKARFGSMQINEPARGFNLIKQLTLKQGPSNAVCNVADLTKSQSSVRISTVQVVDSAFTKTLQPNVVGAPTQYRVSRTPSFTGAKWQRFDTAIPLSAGLSEEASVYIQMRRYTSLDKSWIEARSEVVNVRLPTYE